MTALAPGYAPDVLGDDALDDLRRRLYRPGATPADVDRYVASQEREPPAAAPDQGRAPQRRRSRRRVIVACGLVVAVGTALPLVLHASRPAPARTASTAPRTVLEDVGDGDVLRVDQRAVSPAVAVAVDVGRSAVTGQRYRGRGPGVVEVEPAVGATGTGRERVSVRAASSPVPWRALQTVTRPDWTSSVVVVARGLGAADPPFAFDGAAATRIVVAAPRGVRWTLVVAIARDPGAG